MEKILKKALKSFKIKGEIEFMCGCLSEGDFGTYAEGYGITIEGSKDDAWGLKIKLEKYFEENCDGSFDFYYGEQTASADRNHDLEEESYNFANVQIILSNHRRFEK